MLQWVGKKPLNTLPAYPAQHIENFQPQTPADALAEVDWKDWPDKYPHGGLLFHGDNKDVLAHLLANGFRGKVKLIYIDPPFDSGADYVRKVNLRGTASAKLDGEDYSLGEQVQYTDIWANDNYLQFMYERFILLKELLSKDGSIFVHCDNRKMHHLRCLLEEVFGADSFRNEIVWIHQIMGGAHDKRFPKAHETIFWFAADEIKLQSQDSNVRVPFGEYVKNTMQQDDDGRWYYERRRMSRKATTEEAASKAHTRTYVDDPSKGTVATDVWGNMLSYQETSDEREGLDLYPTQKTTRLLTRIISAASTTGDIVLDCFMGSGVVAKVAQQLGRRWIGCDINKGAIQTTAKRLQTIIKEQIATTANDRQTSLIEDDEHTPVKPAQLSFSVWRVNDYDLHIQHNEAVELVAEHLGIQRIKSEGFFDGTRGKYWVKIIPFNHPLTPLDLDSIRSELSNRPSEERDVQVVTLGMELAAKAWVEQHNRNRPINRFHVIELRTDKKYGGIIKHEPAFADVSVSRGTRHGEACLIVEIVDVVSPSIVQRLNLDTSLFRAQIPEWRAVVDCVLIDTAYDGEVFNICLSDVPERKQELCHGRYELPDPPLGSRVAVKIIDMLGEEIVVVSQI